MIRLCYPVSDMILIPMTDESNAHLFDFVDVATWVYSKDGRPNGRIPTIVGHGLEDIWGGENAIRAAGYTKHWLVFEYHKTGKITFGNYGSFICSPNLEDKLYAQQMYEPDIKLLMTL